MYRTHRHMKEHTDPLVYVAIILSAILIVELVALGVLVIL